MSERVYEDSPEPLNDRERRLLKRMFSDYAEVPGEWKSSMRFDLERDPPILGRQTLGGQASVQEGSILNVHVADGAGIALGKLASTGQIGTASALVIVSAGIQLGVVSPVTVRHAAGRLELVADTIRLGAAGDIQLVRSAADTLDVDDMLRVMHNAGSETQTSAYLVINGTVRQVKVGANGTGPGGVGRALFVDNA